MGYEFNSYPKTTKNSRVQDRRHTANGIDPALCCSFHYVPSLSSLVSGSKTQIQKTLHRNRNKFILAVNQ